ncbi:unnamed protein product [Lymnaea stagnalis]|uniref:Transmembrane protein n=1 Tax=Lymnaea stagnalis TaxID=6523 RepID=A0AAV2H3I6_LYMST
MSKYQINKLIQILIVELKDFLLNFLYFRLEKRYYCFIKIFFTKLEFLDVRAICMLSSVLCFGCQSNLYAVFSALCFGCHSNLYAVFSCSLFWMSEQFVRCLQCSLLGCTIHQSEKFMFTKIGCCKDIIFFIASSCAILKSLFAALDIQKYYLLYFHIQEVPLPTLEVLLILSNSNSK